MKIKRFIITLILYLSIAVNASAFLPLAIPAVVGAIAVVGTAALIGTSYYYLVPNSYKVDSNANVSIASAVTYIELARTIPAVIVDNVTASLSFEKITSKANEKNADGTDKYILTKNALNKTDSYIDHIDAKNTTGGQPIGKVVESRTGEYYQITGGVTATDFYGGIKIDGGNNIMSSFTISYSGGGVVYSISGGAKAFWFQSSDSFICSQQVVQVYPALNTVPRTKLEFADVLNKGLNDHSGSYTNADLDPLLWNEFDGMFTDKTSAALPDVKKDGVPYVPPATVATPAAVAAHNAAGTAAASSAAAQSGLAAAAAAAAAAAIVAQNAAIANPSDPRLANDAAAATAAAAAAAAAALAGTAAQDAAAAAAAAAAVVEEEVPANMPNGETPPTRKKLNLDAWAALKNVASSIGPFALLGTVGHYFDNLVATPKAPVFNLPVWGHNFVIDLGMFDPIAAVFRYLIAAILSVSFVMYIIHFWRGVA